MRKIAFLWTCAAFLVLPFAAEASGIWSSVASAGGMLDSGTPVYETNGPGLTFPSGATATLLKVRYNVANTAETNPSWTNLFFQLRRGQRDGQRLGVLDQTDISTGINTAICSVASGTTSGIKSCSFSSTAFDFTQYNYWILAAVSRSDTSSFPVHFSSADPTDSRPVPANQADRLVSAPWRTFDLRRTQT